MISIISSCEVSHFGSSYLTRQWMSWWLMTVNKHLQVVQDKNDDNIFLLAT